MPSESQPNVAEPRVPLHEPAAENSARVAGNSTKGIVLVVDAEPLVCWAVAEVLSDSGYEVTAAYDVASAIRALTDTTDVVLLDVGTPGSSDLPLLSAMRRLSPATPVILMTAYGSPDLLDEAKRLGACTVIDKPFEMTELAPLVDHVLRGRSS